MVRIKGNFLDALPFWMSLLFVPLVALAAIAGGWTLALPPLFAVLVMTVLDAVFGHERDNADPLTDEARLYWHRLVTIIWLPVQLLLIFGSLIWIFATDHLAIWEEVALMLVVGLLSGGIGIVYAHELMHQKNRFERALGEILMITVLYGHFVTEHLAVHHRYVGTPHDAATARYNESIYRFFLRVLPGSFLSAWRVEAERQRRKGNPVWWFANPFWRYLGGALFVLVLAFAIGGWVGVGFYVLQAFFAVWQLEQINYIEHYGLQRQRLDSGKYEHIKPRHSWNSDHRVTNYMLINLQRHSDHHAKPDRRYPVLQTYNEEEAPQLPASYPILTWLVYIPPLWRRIMNPRVRAWRRKFYPEIEDWSVRKLGRKVTPAA